MKEEYTHPTVEVDSVTLESNIAVQSPIRNIDVEAWEPDEVITPDTGDIFLAI